MNERIEGFTFFRSYLDAISEMDDPVKLEVLTAIIAYGLDGIEPALSNPISRAIFRIAKPSLDSTRDSVLNGKKGGRPKKKAPLSENENPPFENSETTKTIDKDIDLDKDIDKDCIVKADKPPKHTRFAPPSVEEVLSYCQERRNQIDPEKFVDFYTSKGWKVGSQPMKDWRAAVRNWEKTDVYKRQKETSGNIFLDIAREEGIL